MSLDTPVFVRCPKCGVSMLNLRHDDIDIEYGFVRCNNCGFKFDNETLGRTPSNHTISLKIPNLPKTISIRDEESTSLVKLSITDINYSYVKGVFHFTISGKKKFDNLGDCNLTDCSLTWTILNTSKKIFETNDIYIPSLFTDDDFTVDFNSATPMFTNKDMVLQFSLSPTKKQEEQPEECDLFEFRRLWDDTVGIRAIDTINVEEIIIPEEYSGYKVSTILANGFKGQTNLKSVIIPHSVKKIERGAFAGCINLKELNTSENLTDIEDNSFENCSIEKAILPVIALPYIELENLIWLEITKGNRHGYLSEERIKGNFAYACPKLEKLVIHKGIKAIEDYAFYQCKTLKTISFPEDIRIGKGAFCACPNIDEVIIPAGVEICDSAFSQSKIKKLIATKKIPYIWNDAFSFTEIQQAIVSTSFINSIKNCDIYDLEIRGNGKSIYGNPFVYGNHLSRVIISPNVTEIDEKVFKGCPIRVASFSMDIFPYIPKENLEIVEISRGDAITDYAFSDCEKLKEVTIDSSIINVADYAFSGCPIEKANVSADLITKIKNDNLKFVIIHSGTDIKDYAFSYCELLEKVELPDSIITIGKNAFSNCCNLVNITLPHNITSIGEYAFSGCEKLEDLVLPPNITTISERMLKGCSSLKNINIHSNIRSIEERAFEGCKELTCIIIPPTVKNIGEDIFYGCENLESLTLYFLGKDENDSDSTIDYYYGYSDSISSLKRLNIHKKEINKLVDFLSNSRIEEIVIGKNVEHIAIPAFEHCLSLKQIAVEDGNLYYHAENGCLIHTESKTLLFACDFATIPADGSVCVIENGACCSFFPPHIPPTITKIKRGAFTEDVHFEGRLIEWQKIEKDEEWNLAWKSGYAKIFCTDGTLSKIKE